MIPPVSHHIQLADAHLYNCMRLPSREAKRNRPALPPSLSRPPASRSSLHRRKCLLTRVSSSARRYRSAPTSPSLRHHCPPPGGCGKRRAEARGGNLGLVEKQFVDSSLSLIYFEEIDGRRWKYLAENEGSSKRFKKGSIRAVCLQTPQAPLRGLVYAVALIEYVVQELMSFIRSYVVPEGFPDSVTPSYMPYMTWRALKNLFGGAMGVFTTHTFEFSWSRQKQGQSWCCSNQLDSQASTLVTRY
ncbi:root UVB sensitive protein [Actinidia rufa]|uniref:Root UVB sensitive protein n=1 Tax=Actinidia rufa TaxID=165716 RepID=A0A7J0EUK6_9ERIC|nr:root UVB sensitive protein [Actinidia rufa]